MATEKEIKRINQLSDGGNLLSTDYLLVERESPAGSGNYESVRVDGGSATNGPTGVTQITTTYSGSALNAGTHFLLGGYKAPAADANLTQASTTVTVGTVSIAYGGHIFVVCSGVGSSNKSSGAVSLTATGTSISDDGTRTTSDTETIIADIEGTDVIANAFFRTTKRWLGQVTITLDNSGATGATTYSLDFNYGIFAHEYNNEVDFTLNQCSFKGYSSNSSSDSFNLTVYKTPQNGDATAFTYSAAAFTGLPSGANNVLVDLATTYASTDNNLVSDSYFNFFQNGLSEDISVTNGEGIVAAVTTSANNEIDYATLKLGIS